VKTKIRKYQDVVELDELNPAMVPNILHALLAYLKLEIVCESTPDYTGFEIRPINN
jgi:hypothetical protein